MLPKATAALVHTGPRHPWLNVPKEVDKTTWDGELCNHSKPSWTGKPEEIEDGDCDELYKSITKDLLLKTFDDGRAVLSEGITKEAVTTFVSSESLPLLVNFNQDTAQKIFSGEIKSRLLAFLSLRSETHEAEVGIMKAMAVENKGKILFVTFNTDEEVHKRILEFFGITDEELQAFRAIQLGKHLAKLKPDNELESMKAFVAKFLAGELKQHLMSEEIPMD